MNNIEKILCDINFFRKELEEVDTLIYQVEQLHELADNFILQEIEPNLERINSFLRKDYSNNVFFYPNLKSLLPYTFINIIYIPRLYCYEITASILKRACVKYIIESDKFDTNTLIDYAKLILEDLDDEIKSREWKS